MQARNIFADVHLKTYSLTQQVLLNEDDTDGQAEELQSIGNPQEELTVNEAEKHEGKYFTNKELEVSQTKINEEQLAT